MQILHGCWRISSGFSHDVWWNLVINIYQNWQILEYLRITWIIPCLLSHPFSSGLILSGQVLLWCALELISLENLSFQNVLLLLHISYFPFNFLSVYSVEKYRNASNAVTSQAKSQSSNPLDNIDCESSPHLTLKSWSTSICLLSFDSQRCRFQGWNCFPSCHSSNTSSSRSHRTTQGQCLSVLWFHNLLVLNPTCLRLRPSLF